MTPKQKLAVLGFTLPEVKSPVGLYVNVTIIGNRLLFAGHGPWVDGKPIIGRLGDDMTIHDGFLAAREVGLGVLASIEATVGLRRIDRLVKAFGMVRCTEDFGAQPSVINGFSDLMIEVFGERSRAVRSAVGQVGLPGGIAVEIEGEFLLKPLSLQDRLELVYQAAAGWLDRLRKGELVLRADRETSKS